MSLENHKITTYQDNVKDLPDYPSDAGITAKQLKDLFDGRTDKEIKEKFNSLIDELVRMFEAAAIETEEAEQNANTFAGALVSAHNGATDAHADIRAITTELRTALDEGLEENRTDSSNKVNTHNESETAHADIRAIITELSVRLNTVADSDDVTLDQLSEIVSYIKDNREVIEVITQDKANASDVYTREEVDEFLKGKVGEEELTGYVKDTDYATEDKAGVVKVKNTLQGKSGIYITEDGYLNVFEALEGDFGSNYPAVITVRNLDKAVKFVGDGYYATAEEVGDISTALDAILAIQNELIGGDSE